MTTSQRKRGILVQVCLLLLSLPMGSPAQTPPADAPDGVVQQRFDDRPAADPAKPPFIDFTKPIELMWLGGYLMWPILFCSVVAVTFAFERWISLRRGRVLPRRFVGGFLRDLDSGRLSRDEAVLRCQQNGSPAAMVILAALRRWGQPMAEIEQAINEGGQREVVVLRRYLRAMQATANISTLLGLLGTIFGMIVAFNQLALAEGQPRTELLAAGIAQALLTTAFGLIVAIPILLVHAYFAGRVEKLVYAIDHLALSVAHRISREALSAADHEAEVDPSHPISLPTPRPPAGPKRRR
jgi:biopolymer transport protein ExbB